MPFLKPWWYCKNGSTLILLLGLAVATGNKILYLFSPLKNFVNKTLISEGGRLEKELEYISKTLGDGSGATNQLLIQTPVEDGRFSTVLSSEALLTHLEVMKSATRVFVEVDDT